MDHTHDIKKEVHRYFLIFGALMILTVITVAISYLNVPTHITVTIALIVATIKGTLVACFFMHLISERQFIYALLISAMIFFLSLGLIIFGYYSTPEGTEIPQSDQRSAIIHDSETTDHSGTSTSSEHNEYPVEHNTKESHH